MSGRTWLRLGLVWWCGSLQSKALLWLHTYFLLAASCLQLWRPQAFTLLSHFRVFFFSWSKLTEGTGTLAQYRGYTVSRGTHLPQCDSVRATHISQLLRCKKQKLGDEAEGSQDSGLRDRRK